MNLQAIFIREEIIKTVRSFFFEKKFHEVITPVLNRALPLEPNLYAFTTSWNTLKRKEELYLATSPESGLKKMVAQGIGNCFAIGKSFRNLEDTSRQHNPEFLMLEWYRENADYNQIMAEVQELIIFVKKRVDLFLKRKFSPEIIYQDQKINLIGDWPKISLEDLFLKYASQKLKNIKEDDFYKIFLNEIEKHLPKTPFFLIGFPSIISPLCTPRKDKPYLAERFELYFFGMEIGNGNTENTDTKAIQKVFLTEEKIRKNKKKVSPVIDKDFLEALTKIRQLADQYAGIGLGIDRLAMIMANASDIKQVEPFFV